MITWLTKRSYRITCNFPIATLYPTGKILLNRPAVDCLGGKRKLSIRIGYDNERKSLIMEKTNGNYSFHCYKFSVRKTQRTAFLTCSRWLKMLGFLPKKKTHYILEPIADTQMFELKPAMLSDINEKILKDAPK